MASAKSTTRWYRWKEQHAADRWRASLALVRSVGANVDRERQSVTRTNYIGAALLAMESLTPAERRAFIDRYAALHGTPLKNVGSTS
ncbi:MULTISPECIES: hypothetical protein [Burkholderiaceae]|uniref:hypothetical protein n=1 Tax=Burkholderiaceae TaxID=119060 RepID=UPI001964E364|nr:hypothetical protein [Burkholderia sp. LMG 13014]